MGDCTRSSKWKLWHPNQGVVFAAGQQPESLYPKLNHARFFTSLTEATECTENVSVAREVSGSSKAGIFQQRTVFTETIAIHGKPETSATATTAAAVQDEVKDNDEKVEDATSEEDDGPIEPPFTPLEFKIPSEAFRDASFAEPGTPESFWSYTLYRGPQENEDTENKVKVHYCKSLHTTERVCQYFLDEKVIGFDLEWASDATKAQGPRRNISLVQIASPSRIALFHLALYPKKDSLLAPTLQKIMEDPNITKTGVFIKGDATRMRNFLGVESRGLFELSNLYKLVKYSSSGEVELVNKKLVSLANQVKEVLHLPMFKGQDVRASDWSLPLKMDQIIYSASDAYAAVQLYAILDHQRQALDPMPPLPYHAELNLPIRLADGVSIPTSDEAGETAEAADVKGDAKIPAALSQEYLKSAGETIKVEAEGDEVEPKPAVPKPPKSRKTPAEQKPKDDRILAAETWLKHYRANPSTAKSRATPASLRAYYIWHANDDLDPLDIAKLLRDPPLQTTTVVSYILEAIKLEKLPFNKIRLRTEVLDLLPKEILSRRYKTLVKACEGADQPAVAKAAQKDLQ
ncbi:putative 3 -5 exonuclease helicase protein [Phaeoacremonium minimum UCRPA7]|uniref:Putative 3-5 exonuclease helicase protein n=1 Tax=Phaeoacremonium minimum (strain UCR-PA7) TaxID=1286976 RepID=R8BEG3_PHAM7|nr:putative 3 -5 exonuclease helicase protein [Phaeoacremonium minimum UCRPA7]EON97699.1 putative 3 -5 exonuclease helicase protein [Phaeoacremonium minimum UCRPA7]